MERKYKRISLFTDITLETAVLTEIKARRYVLQHFSTAEIHSEFS